MARIDRDALQEAVREHCEDVCRHFFSAGKRQLNQWIVGSLDGEPGQSLRIELAGDKAGLAYDFATGQGWDLIDLIKDQTGLRFVQVALEIAKITGANVEESSTNRYTTGKKRGPRYRTSSAGVQICDWDRDYKLSAADIDELAQWRGYSPEFVKWAVTQRVIGRNRKHKQWAFPLHDENGAIVAAHVRSDKNRWFYAPKLTDAGFELRVLIVGDLNGAEKVFFVESQWDGYAIVDRLGIQYGERIALVCTRGASNAALAADIQTNGAELFVLPQNDDPGHTWAEKISTILSAAYKLLAVPTKYHDANDWLKELSDTNELVEGLRNAELKQPTPNQPRIYIECHRPSYFMAYQPPPDLVLCGDNHIVRGGAFVIGGAPGVGKSRAGTACALAGALQVPWFGLEVFFEFRTLIIQTENGRLRLKQEFTEINQPALEDHVMVCSPPPYGLCFGKKEFRDQLRFYQDHLGPHAIILDPWNAVAFDDKMRDYKEAFDTIRDVFGIGTEKGPALGILAHTRKPIAGERVNGRALLSLLAGSYVLGSIPRCVFVMQSASDEVNETRVVWTCCKNNDGKLGSQTVWERRNGLFVPVPDFDWEQFRNEDGRFTRKIKSTIDDLLVLIPGDQPISKEDLYEYAAGKVSRDDIRDYLAQLLREARIFIHKIPRRGKKSGVGYCQTKPTDPDLEESADYDESDESDIEDDPR